MLRCAPNQFVVAFYVFTIFFFFSSRRRHTRCGRDWSSDVCSSDLDLGSAPVCPVGELLRDAGRAHGCGAEVVGGPELPLAGVGEDGPGALGHATEDRKSVV